ncbi:MAG: V-type ATP synthase subunit E family protein [Firmicutes bacterium]|nr:V-type ATP synthase subunit E family protein [Bacillota bacterium]
MGKKEIISKILETAKAEADLLLSEAQAEAEALIGSAQAMADRSYKDALQQAEAEVRAIKERQEASSKNATRDVYVNAQNEVLEIAFSKAREAFAKMKDADYKKLFETLIISVADDGDEVVVSKKDEKVFTQAFIDGAAKKAGKKLKIAKHKNELQSGLLLTGKRADKIITIEALVANTRVDIEPSVVAQLINA